MRSRLRQAVVVLVPVTLAAAGMLNVHPRTNLADPARPHNRPVQFQQGADLLDISLAHGSGAARGRYGPYLLFDEVFGEPRIVARVDHGLNKGLMLGLARGELLIDEYDDLLTEAETNRLEKLPHFEGVLEDGPRYVVVKPDADGDTVRVMKHDDTLYIAQERAFGPGGTG